jgi:hypothetical protein
MRQLRPVLLLLLLATCTEKVEVTINEPIAGWEAYGMETISVTCRPARNVSYVELLVDSVVVGLDSFLPYDFVWDVTPLREASVHKVQARATSGSREYLSPELLATVGYRSRLVLDGPGESLWVYRPDGARDAGFIPLAGANPAYPRFRPGCRQVVFVGHRKLYEAEVPYGQAQLLDSVENGIYSCDASPVSGLVAFEGFPAATAHLFTQDGSSARVQLTHDSDVVLIDSSRFTCIANSGPVFSPDGNKLAYYRESKCFVTGDPHEGETRQDAFVMNRDGSNPVNLTPDVDNGYFSGFTWTFDGKWVLFREGMNITPDRVLAVNMGGRTMTGLAVSPVAMACSPTDSTLAYVGTESERRLHSARLVWTNDTLYVSGSGSVLSDESFDTYIDWVDFSGQ